MQWKLSKIRGTALLVVICISCFADGQVPVAQRAVLDLRKQNLFAKSVSLSGEWGFYWNHLLTPDTSYPFFLPLVQPPCCGKICWLTVRKSPPGYATYTLTIPFTGQRG